MLKPYWSLTNLAWGLVYLGLMGALCWQLFALRANIESKLATPTAQADWENWRIETAKTGPVARRVPSSTEPPALVLMRDYFVTCLAVSLFFSTLLYLVMMVLIRGAFRSSDRST